MGRLNDPGREARSRMAREEESRRRAGQGKAPGEGAPSPRRPTRYKLYDRIADRVSLNAINAVIIATAVLLVVALVYGIVSGSRG